jgi:DNA topoisomerase IA
MSRLRSGLVVFAIALSVVAFGVNQPLGAMECQRDSISDVSENGDVVKTLSGHIYEVDDTSESSLWLPAEDLLICAEYVSIKGQAHLIYQLIDKDQGGDEVSAQKLK